MVLPDHQLLCLTMASDPLDLWEVMEVQDMDMAAQAMVLHMGKVHPRLLDMGHLLVNLKLPSMVNNHPRFLPLVSNNKANLALVRSRKKSHLRLVYAFLIDSFLYLDFISRLSRVGKGCKGVKRADNSDGFGF